MTGQITQFATNAPGNLTDWIKQAMQLTNAPDNWLPALQTIAMHESDGDPNNVNTYDINWQQGHPSKGVMQMIDDSFSENMVAGHNNIFNPVDNIASAIGYIRRTYGDVNNVPGIKALARGGNYVGYASGSEYVPETDRYQINEKGEETILLNKGSGVVTSERTRGLNILADNVPNIMNTVDKLSMFMPQLNTPDFSNIQLPQQSQNVDNSKKFSINHVEIVQPTDFEDFVTQFEQYVITHT